MEVEAEREPEEVQLDALLSSDQDASETEERELHAGAARRGKRGERAPGR